MSESDYRPNSAQQLLAEEVTRFVHGQPGLDEALRATQVHCHQLNAITMMAWTSGCCDLIGQACRLELRRTAGCHRARSHRQGRRPCTWISATSTPGFVALTAWHAPAARRACATVAGARGRQVPRRGPWCAGMLRSTCVPWR